MHQMRAVSLMGFVDVARYVGLDGARMLREAGLSPAALEDPENRLPAALVVRLLERSAEASGCESFGLLMVEARSFASLGPVSLLLERLPNTREAVRAAIEFQRHFNDVIAMSMCDEDDTSIIRLDFVPGLHSVQATDMFVGMAYRTLSAASGSRWRPEEVHVTHKAPADLSAWRRMFPVTVHFESSFDGFCSTPAAMSAPNPLADETMAGHARALLSRVPVASLATPLSERAASAIALLLPDGRVSIETVAAQLGMSPRTLQRHLDDEGTRFGEVLGRVRRERAMVYLAGSERPVTAIAGLLGYDSPSSFTRWFAGEFGTSPQAWRARQREETKGPPPIWRR
jgi:AraC-like DNA-binding protein